MSLTTSLVLHWLCYAGGIVPWRGWSAAAWWWSHDYWLMCQQFRFGVGDFPLYTCMQYTHAHETIVRHVTGKVSLSHTLLLLGVVQQPATTQHCVLGGDSSRSTDARRWTARRRWCPCRPLKVGAHAALKHQCHRIAHAPCIACDTVYLWL